MLWEVGWRGSKSGDSERVKREGDGLGLADGSGVCPVGGYTFVLSQSEKWGMSGVETTCPRNGGCVGR